jgi:hypothetical protein
MPAGLKSKSAGFSDEVQKPGAFGALSCRLPALLPTARRIGKATPHREGAWRPMKDSGGSDCGPGCHILVEIYIPEVKTGHMAFPNDRAHRLEPARLQAPSGYRPGAFTARWHFAPLITHSCHMTALRRHLTRARRPHRAARGHMGTTRAIRPECTFPAKRYGSCFRALNTGSHYSSTLGDGRVVSRPGCFAAARDGWG